MLRHSCVNSNNKPQINLKQFINDYNSKTKAKCICVVYSSCFRPVRSFLSAETLQGTSSYKKYPTVSTISSTLIRYVSCHPLRGMYWPYAVSGAVDRLTLLVDVALDHQVLVGIMSREVVGDDPAWNAQSTSHCRREKVRGNSAKVAHKVDVLFSRYSYFNYLAIKEVMLAWWKPEVWICFRLYTK